jgi:hypothetical protein
MRTAIPCALVLGLLHLAASTSLDAADVKIKTEYDRTADFVSLHSYRWLPTPPYTIGMAPEARDERLERDALDAPIRSAIDKVLGGKRFSVAEGASEPDFHIVYYAAVGVGMNADVLGAHYTYLTGWGSPLLGATPTTSLRVIEQGTIVVDILRRDRTTAIWRATATGAIDRSRNRQQRLRTIEEAAKKMFARFPPKR